jgi:fluoroacetyl-CoA thioesterase
MKESLKPGLKYSFTYTVPDEKTVPHLLPESEEFRAMPPVLATGFLVGLIEWACIRALSPHLDEGEGSLGVHIDVSHIAATPPGFTVTVDVECLAVRGPRVHFTVRIHDGVDLIGQGRHERYVLRWQHFIRRVEKKARLLPPT